VAGDNTFDAILFATNEIKPRLVKIPWKLIRGGKHTTSYQKLDTNIWFKNANTAMMTQYFHRWEKGTNGSKRGVSFCFMYDDNFLINGSPLNRCIVDVTGGRAGYPWCGNILALRTKSPFNCDFYANVDIQEDIKVFVTIFEKYVQEMPIDQRRRREERTCCGCTIA
jgi:hypothetical protein